MKALKRFWTYRHALLPVWIILYFCATALAAPILAPQSNPADPAVFQLVNPIQTKYPNPPDADYPLGTLPFGRLGQQHADVFFTLIWGARSALIFGLAATLIAGTVGSLVGALSSYLGGAAGGAILRITDAFLAFPVIAGIVFFSQTIFPTYRFSEPTPIQQFLFGLGIDNVMLALVCFSWMPYTRVIHADMQRIRHADFITAAQAIGVSPVRMIARHLIPNSVNNVIVLATRDVGGFVLLQATFSFMGVGGGSPWGELLATGRNWILGARGNPFQYWWVFVPVTAALIVFGVGWSLLGDFLNDWLNPRLRNFAPD